MYVYLTSVLLYVVRPRAVGMHLLNCCHTCPISLVCVYALPRPHMAYGLNPHRDMPCPCGLGPHLCSWTCGQKFWQEYYLLASLCTYGVVHIAGVRAFAWVAHLADLENLGILSIWVAHLAHLRVFAWRITTGTMENDLGRRHGLHGQFQGELPSEDPERMSFSVLLDQRNSCNSWGFWFLGRHPPPQTPPLSRPGGLQIWICILDVIFGKWVYIPEYIYISILWI